MPWPNQGRLKAYDAAAAVNVDKELWTRESRVQTLERIGLSNYRLDCPPLFSFQALM